MARRTTTTTPDLHGHVHVHPSLMGLFRQDGLKLWQWDGSSEALLHDVDLAAGDTLPLTLTSWNTDIIITDIYSVLVGTEWRKRFALANSWSPNMIEGIGSMHGPFEPVSNFFDRGYMLACFGLDTLGYFPAPGPSCALAMSIGAKATEAQQLSAFPNPASNELVVTFPGELTKVQRQLCDLQGRTVATANSSGERMSVDESGLPVGIYVLRVGGRRQRVLVAR